MKKRFCSEKFIIYINHHSIPSIMWPNDWYCRNGFFRSSIERKGIRITISDNIIKTKISNLILKYDKELIAETKIFVNNGSVLFTGKVKPNDKIQITKLAWTIRGVREVITRFKSLTLLIKNIARDIASLGEIRARIMSDKSINSINYSIDVVNDKAYISGVASNETEMNLVKIMLLVQDLLRKSTVIYY